NTSNFNTNAANGMPAPRHLSLGQQSIVSLSNNLFRGSSLVKGGDGNAIFYKNGVDVYDDSPYNPVDR
ncbi:MAG: hypothetical protein II565_08295, partial [Fibrobacter sp.]|nr:hypothetical protein [Fibrobacter sp.]